MVHRIRLMFVSIIFLLSAFSSHVFAESVSLEEAYNRALAHSPLIQMMQAQGQAAQSLKDQVQTKRLPTFSLNSTYSRGDDPVYVFGSLLRQGRFGPANFAVDSLNSPSDLTNFSNSVTAGLPLFTGFQITGRTEMADAGRRWTEAGMDEVRNRIGVSVAESYLDVVLGRQTIKILSQGIQSGESDLADSDRLMKKGLILGSDYYAARAILESLKAALIQAQMVTDQADMQLRMLMGLDKNIPLDIEGALKAPTNLSTSNASTVYAQNLPDLRMAQAQVELARADRKIQGRSLLPEVMAFGSLETNTEDFSSNPSHHMGGVKMDIPLGDPTYLARKGESDYKLKAAEKNYDQIRENAQIELETLSRQIKGVQDSLPLITSARIMAEKSLDLFRPLVREGRQSVMEVLRAEDALIRAHRAELDSISNLHKLKLRWEAAQGPLPAPSFHQLSESLLQGVQP